MPFILGPQTRETDFSMYIASISKTKIGIVGTATKGELGVPTLITSQSQFASIFGERNPNCLATYAAMLYLAQANVLWFTRVAGTSAAKSTISVNGGTTPTAVKFEGKTPGTGYDGTAIVISEISGNICKVTVVDNYGRKVEEHTVSTDSTASNFIDTVINNNSKVLSAEYLIAQAEPLIAGTYKLTGGNDGVSDVASGDYLGDAILKGGLESMRSTSVDINILTVPGVTTPEVVKAGFNVAEKRGDTLFLPDPPLGLTVQEVIDWHNGAGTYDHGAFNSSYGALYWAWQQIYDPVNDQTVWVPPSAFAATAFAYNDRVSEVWFAPAGLQRGLLKDVIKSEYNPDEGEQLMLYGNGNNINPIIKHPNAGIAIFGQKTLQRESSATDRVNVRRLLLYLRKVIAGTTAYLTFEPNDRVTWNEFEDLVEPVLRGVKAKRGVYDYLIQMDDTIVTPDEIDDYSMPGRIYIKPTKAAEAIPIDFVITRTGANFKNE